MLNDYEDITKRIQEPPLWWDEHGVPRYNSFGPHEVANIYADEIALVEIACQGCGAKFQVAFSLDAMDRFNVRNGSPLADDIRDGSLHYGDPPNYGPCCASGPTMNCEDLRVLEYWKKAENIMDWERDKTLEIVLPDGKEKAND